MMYFSVAIGRQTGVFLRWQTYYESVRGYIGAVDRKSDTLGEATRHLNQWGVKHSTIYIRTEDTSTPLDEYCTENSLLIPAEVDYSRLTLFLIGYGVYAKVIELRGKFCVHSIG
jgi:hypothetical protein